MAVIDLRDDAVHLVAFEEGRDERAHCLSSHAPPWLAGGQCDADLDGARWIEHHAGGAVSE